MKDDDYFIDLLLKEADGLISALELAELQEWLGASSQNREKAKKLYEAWNLTDKPAGNVKIDLDREYAAVQQKIRKGSKLRRLPFWYMAASILLLLSSGVIAYFVFQGPDKRPTVYHGPVDQLGLPDGTMVSLAEGARLNLDFTSDLRNVALLGKGYFQVQTMGQRPFIVESTHGAIRVTGTSFGVDANDERLEVQVEEGKVLLYQQEERVELVAGETGIISMSGIDKQASQSPVAAWRLSPVIFDQAPFADVLEVVEANYAVQFEVADSSVLSCLVSYTLAFPDLPDLITIFQTLLDIQITRQDDVDYLISGSGCR